MPVPRDGALLGWVTHRQVTVMLAVYPGTGALERPLPVPDIRVMPMAGTANCCTGRRSPPARSRTDGCGSTWTGELVDSA